MLAFALLSFAFSNAQAQAQAQAQDVVTHEVGKSLYLENVDPGVEQIGREVGRHMRTQNSYMARGWTHDGKALLFARNGALFRAKTARSKFTRVVRYRDFNISGARLAQVCGKDGYVFTDDEDGDEYDAVYVGTASDFKPAKVSPGRASNRGVLISNDGSRMVYASSAENSGQWQLFLQPVCAGAAATTLISGPESVYPFDFHPDDTHFLVLRTLADGTGELIEFDLASGTSRTILREATPIRSAGYSSDGEHIFFTSDAASEFRQLYRLTRADDTIITVIGGIGMDIDRSAMSGNRQRMALALNEYGLSRVMVIDLDKLRLVAGPSEKALGVISGMYMSHDGETLAINLSQPTVPARSGVYDVQTDSFQPWSGGFAPGQRMAELVPTITTYPAPDKIGEEDAAIPMLVYKPSTASADRKAPVVIFAHGGPASQARPSFGRFYHYIVTELGIAVLRPNIRGSTGYGRTYEQADQGLKREAAIRDIGALLDWIETQPDLDSDRVVIAGGSYGGFVSLASLVAYSDRLRGGISSVGISDFETFLKNTEPYRVENRRREYGDERDPKMREFFKTISPLANVGKISVPALIVQGGNDPRVPQQQAEDMIAAMRKAGLDVSYVLARDEGHNFSKSRNRSVATGAQIEFLRDRLLKD
ncbi:S9 family peptidase [Pacificimonas sp. WHA3]|uniref:S9 family peptidase n=1 Tax=Pacificimonas pallii TaxID=2827236 RepID=A0ABS6SBS0_9SPHN|nr:alpha/beta fold hydrolase [Pacificimonas pallii]MBV7255867.1 S9 family peptidase [Pacificimonas pallii]